MAPSSRQDNNNSPPRIPGLDIDALIHSAITAQSNAVSASGYVPDVAAYFQSTMSGRMTAPASSSAAPKRTAAVAFDVDEDDIKNENEDKDEDEGENNGKENDDDKAAAPRDKASKIYRKATDDVRRIKVPAKLSQRRGAAWNRNRRGAEDEDRKKLCEKIDDDILKQVDADGGSTPAGRVFRSALAMIERLEGEKDQVAALKAENEAMKALIAQFQSVLE